ncbi:36465_t:CDS:2, partial [Racocetra persica]
SSDEWYVDARLEEKTCQLFMKNICRTVGIEIGNRNLVNHSGCSTSITSLFRQGVPLVTTMSITGHKSESSYRIYARPSVKQKEDALSRIISSIGTLPSSNDQSIPSISSANRLLKSKCERLCASSCHFL